LLIVLASHISGPTEEQSLDTRPVPHLDYRESNPSMSGIGRRSLGWILSDA